MAKKKKITLLTKANPVKLDIACGDNKHEGFIGVDIAGESADIFFDLEQFPWTFAEDESVTEATCQHYIEHTKDLMKFMNELHRILIPGGKCNIIAPYYSSMRAWQDPTHTRAISEATFLYYNQEWLKANKLSHYPITADFDFAYGHAFTEDYANKHFDARQFGLRHYNNVINDIHVTLTKKVKETK